MELINLLNKQEKVIDKLINLADKEKEFIIENKLKELTDLNLNKEKIIKKSHDLEKRRIDLLREFLDNHKINRDPLKTKVNDIIDLVDEKYKEKLKKIRNRLKSKSKKLKQKNKLNKILIKDQIEYTQFMLNLIFNSSDENFYNDKGSKRNSKESKVLNMKG